MSFHPASLIITWTLVTVSLQVLMPKVLLVASGMVYLCAFLVSHHKFLLLLRRTRWVMISLLLIYAYSTPGRALIPGLDLLSPTMEGLMDGGLQLLRLLAALAALSILLDRLHRDQLILGLYVLFVPLQWLGISRDRLAVRLSLTLQYAEAAMLRGAKDWQAALHDVFASHEEQGKELHLNSMNFSLGDLLLVVGTIMMIWLATR